MLINRVKSLNLLVKNREYRINFFASRGLYNWMPDKMFIKMKYKIKMGKRLNIEEPKTYNEKLQWMKLYDRNPLYSTLVDKYSVKKYVIDKIGSQYVIPTLGIWENFDDIDFDKLPSRFVLKCTHDSGGLFICKDKENIDYKHLKKTMLKSFSKNFYWEGREWPYKNVKPRIIAETYMEDAKTGELRDYKFFVFNGKVKAMFIASDRHKENEETKFDFFDEEYNHLNIRQGHPNAMTPPEKPKCFEKMKELAETLSKDLKAARIDFYEVNGRVYFGEITFFHHGGWTPFEPEEWDYVFGAWLELQ